MLKCCSASPSAVNGSCKNKHNFPFPSPGLASDVCRKGKKTGYMQHKFLPWKEKWVAYFSGRVSETYWIRTSGVVLRAVKWGAGLCSALTCWPGDCGMRCHKVDASLGCFFQSTAEQWESYILLELDLARISSFAGVTPCGIRHFCLGICIWRLLANLVLNVWTVKINPQKIHGCTPASVLLKYSGKD